jgi:hypothetical protein
MSGLRHRFPSTDGGYFGERSTRNTRRQIRSDDPDTAASDFFDEASKGATSVYRLPNGGYVAEFPDDTQITYRPRSGSDGSPAIDINVDENPNGWVMSQRIHFIKE